MATLTKCWEWPFAKRPNGYGQRTYKGKTWGAHKAAFDEAYGPVPRGIWVLHICDNRLCVRPSHLFLGTPKDNQQDMVNKGRKKYMCLIHDDWRICPNGKRCCKTCRRDWQRKYRRHDA